MRTRTAILSKLPLVWKVKSVTNCLLPTSIKKYLGGGGGAEDVKPFSPTSWPEPDMFVYDGVP